MFYFHLWSSRARHSKHNNCLKYLHSVSHPTQILKLSQREKNTFLISKIFLLTCNRQKKFFFFSHFNDEKFPFFCSFVCVFLRKKKSFLWRKNRKKKKNFSKRKMLEKKFFFLFFLLFFRISLSFSWWMFTKKGTLQKKSGGFLDLPFVFVCVCVHNGIRLKTEL